MKLQNLTLILIVALLVALTIGFYGGKRSNIGSVAQGSEYTATTTDSGEAGTHLQAKSTANTSYCVLGSVTIASSSATSFTIWNATSTTDISSSTIAVFEADAAEGTYVFDSACTRGIILAAPSGFNGSFVTTYR